MFLKLRNQVKSNSAAVSNKKDMDSLIKDLSSIFKVKDQNNKNRDERIKQYKELAKDAAYVGEEIVEYDKNYWYKEAIKEKIRGLCDRSTFLLVRWDPFKDKYYWKNAAGHKKTHWYKFQEAVRAHQKEAWDILDKPVFQKLELAEF